MSSHLAERIAAPLNLATRDADRGVPRLPEGWLVGWDCDIGGPPGHPVRVPLVVLHPAFGVALLGSGKGVEDAEQVLGRRLTEARFAAIFAGHLPILNGGIETPELPRLVPILLDAFGRVPPLALAGGDAWVATVMRLVAPSGMGWTDNLQGLPPAALPGWVTPAEAERSAWYGGPAAVLPLRRVAEPQPEAAAPEQTLPLPDPKPIEPRRWPWALCAMASAVAMVLSLELSYSGDAPTPAPATASLDAATVPPAAVEAPAPAPDGNLAMAIDTARPAAIPAPVVAAPVVAAPRPVVLPVASSRTSTAPPRTAKPPRPEAARHAQAQPAKAKPVAAVKPASTTRREAAKRGQASG